jgi:hypothetical protein
VLARLDRLLPEVTVDVEAVPDKPDGQRPDRGVRFDGQVRHHVADPPLAAQRRGVPLLGGEVGEVGGELPPDLVGRRPHVEGHGCLRSTTQVNG